jgi:hypothetical protein
MVWRNARGGHDAHPWHAHQSARRFIGLCLLADALVEHCLLLLNLFMHGQQAFDN